MAEDEKIKQIEKALAEELDKKVNLSNPTDVRIEGGVQLNPELKTEMPKKAEPTPGATGSGQPAKPEVNLVTTPPEPRAPAAQPPTSASGASGAPAATAAPGGAAQAGSGASPAAPAAGGATAGAQPGAPGGQGTTGQAPELSLDAIDNLLDDIDGDFKKNLTEVGRDLKEATSNLQLPQSLVIDKDFLGEDDDKDKSKAKPVEEVVEPAAPIPEDAFLKLVKAVFNLIISTIFLIPKILSGIPNEIRRAPSVGAKQALKDFVVVVRVPVNLWKVSWHDLLRSAKDFGRYLLASSWSYKSKLISMVVMIVVTWALISHVVKRLKWEANKDKYLGSFSEVTDTFQPIEGEDGEDLDSPTKHPEYVVGIKTVIASLKATDPKKNPMGRVELYLEASSQDAATEIKDREIEVRDIVARILEQSTFDELESSQGKSRFKVMVRKELNRFLNKGRVQRVFFKYFVVHPGT